MFIKENNWRDALPLYDVKELSMEEALLVLAAEKEQLRDDLVASSAPPFPDVDLSDGRSQVAA